MNLDSKKITNSRILVTGGDGFLGRYVVKQLIKSGFDKDKIFTPTSRQADLRIKTACKKVVKDVDIVIHLAGVVGGIGFNQQFPATLFFDNAIMGLQLIEEARLAGVKKFVTIGTVCSYPKHTPTPFNEDELWNGYPEETNAPYGLAKKMLLVQSQAYAAQYGFNAIYLIPVNLYGPGDNFDNESSHVIPALIKKFLLAKKEKSESVSVWGTGKATREFLFVEDAAKAIVQATLLYNKTDPVNIGSSQEISIKKLSHLIAEIVGYKGKIIFDHTKPDGQMKRKLDTSLAKEQFGFSSSMPFEKGLSKTIKWYLSLEKNK